MKGITDTEIIVANSAPMSGPLHCQRRSDERRDPVLF